MTGESMKRNKYLIIAAAGLLCGVDLVVTIGAQTASSEKHVFMPDAIPYGPAPSFVVAGAQLAVLEGNPGAASGDYTIRLKIPDGYRIAPHWHPQRENVTVSLELSRSGWEIALTRARWELSHPAVLLPSTPICITTRWPVERSWSKSTANLLCNSITSILTTIQAVRNNRLGRCH